MRNLESRFKNHQPAVVGLFKSHMVLEKLLEDLKNKNFKNDDVSILMARRKDLKKSSYNKKSIWEEVATGAVTGTAEGGVLLWLASLGVISIPGAGTFIAAGPIISAVAGITLGLNVGCIAGALIGFGVAEVEARRIENFIKDKGVLVSVHVNDPREMLVAKQILVTNGAVKVINPLKEIKKENKNKFFSPKLGEASHV